MSERIEDILREMRNEDEIGKMISALPDGVRNDGSAEYLRSLADRIERAWTEDEQTLAMAAHLAGMEQVKKRDACIERVVRDAIISYEEQYANAPNVECEQEIIRRASVANAWLESHGFKPEKITLSKEEVSDL